MKVINRATEADETFDLSPMIDIVFLLLIYFMVTTTLVVQESDLGIQLPADAPVESPQDFPLEVTIDIMPTGQVLLNGEPIDTVGSRDMPNLTGRLIQLRQSTQGAGTPMFVTIQPNPEAPHQRSMDVLNSLAKARVRQVSFSMDE